MLEAPGPVAASGARPADAALATAEGTRGPGTHPRPSLETGEQIVRRLMTEAYAERVKGERAPQEDLFEAGVREVMRRTAEYRESYARNLGAGLEYREQTRAKIGEIKGSPLLLQMCVAGGGRVRLTEQGNSGPLRIDGPPGPGAKETHVTCGMVQPGRMFLIERVVVRAYLGSRVALRVALPETESLTWDPAERGTNTVDTELKGLVRLRHGYENRVEMYGHGVAAALEIHGRLVPEAEGEAAQPTPLAMGGGWLTGEPVLMQVLADHGGGNPRTVHLDGKLYRIDSLEPESIWTDSPRLRERRSSVAHYRGCGRVPPGKAFRITRVEYRAQLDTKEPSLSSLIVSVGGEERVKTDASQGTPVAGAWTGDVLIFPGKERDVSVTCSYYGLAEILVYGELVDDPRGAK